MASTSLIIQQIPTPSPTAAAEGASMMRTLMFAGFLLLVLLLFAAVTACSLCTAQWHRRLRRRDMEDMLQEGEAGNIQLD